MPPGDSPANHKAVAARAARYRTARRPASRGLPRSLRAHRRAWPKPCLHAPSDLGGGGWRGRGQTDTRRGHGRNLVGRSGLPTRHCFGYRPSQSNRATVGSITPCARRPPRCSTSTPLRPPTNEMLVPGYRRSAQSGKSWSTSLSGNLDHTVAGMRHPRRIYRTSPNDIRGLIVGGCSRLERGLRAVTVRVQGMPCGRHRMHRQTRAPTACTGETHAQATCRLHRRGRLRQVPET